MTPVEINYHLLRRLARITYHQADVEAVRDLLASPAFDRGLFTAACFKQKVAGLVYLNLRRWGFERLVPWLTLSLQLFYAANQERNRRLQALTRELLDAFEAHDVDVRPVKGAVLVPLVYADGGSRLLIDIDLFVDRKDLMRAAAVFTEMGYIQGTHDSHRDVLVPLTREERLLWHLKVFETPPFAKMVDDTYASLWGVLYIDLSFGLGFAEADNVPGTVLADGADIAGFRTLSVVDFFIQLCAHLYKEASNESWIEHDQDMNLIKFCDVREYTLKQFTAADAARIRSRAQQLGVERTVYFSLHYVHELYGDPLIGDLLAALDFSYDDTAFMHEIYRQGTKAVGTRRKTLIETIGLA